MMNQYSETQQNLEQQQQENQLLLCKKAGSQPEQYSCTTAVTPTAPTKLEPATFLHHASSIAAIIQGITLLVVVLTKFSKVLVPLIRQKPLEKIRSTFHRKVDAKSHD